MDIITESLLPDAEAYLNLSPTWKNYRPMAIGFKEEVRHPNQLVRRAIRKLLKIRANEAAYCSLIAAGGYRYHADGSQAAPISQEDIQYTKTKLNSPFE